MLNIRKFDDINYLELNNIEGERILNLFYNDSYNKIIDKSTNLNKTIIALVQFGDNSFGVIDNQSINKDNTIIYGIKLDDCLYELDVKALLPFNIIMEYNLINSSGIMQYNISKCIDNRHIKYVFTQDGYYQF